MSNESGSSESNENISGFTMVDGYVGDVELTGEAWVGQDIIDNELASGVLTDQYKALIAFDGQASIMKIEPVVRKQNFTYHEVAYISEGLSYPQIQRVPVSNPQITPHQISFDFFDTTEGKIGVSNATEKHMIVEGDIYVTELIYYFWDHANAQSSGKPGDHTTGVRAAKKNLDMVNAIVSGIRDEGKTNKEIDKTLDRSTDDSQLSFTGADKYSALGIDYLTHNFEETQAFINFRNTFLMTFSGWVCKFTSQVFGTFYGVFTEISYNIEDGYSDAKWHFKIEEAIFTEDYSIDGKKGGTSGDGNQNDTYNSGSNPKGSTTDSGDAPQGGD